LSVCDVGVHRTVLIFLQIHENYPMVFVSGWHGSTNLPLGDPPEIPGLLWKTGFQCEKLAITLKWLR